MGGVVGMDLIAGVGIGFLLTILFFLAVWLVAAAARRILGVPVGWPRTFLVGTSMVAGLGAGTSYLYRAAGFSPDTASTADPIVLLGFGTIAVFWIFALGVALLVGLEIMLPTGTLPNLRSLLTGWGARRRRGQRYTQVLAIAARHGLGSQIRGVRRNEIDQDVRTARSLRLAFEDAGVAFVKLGQMLSTRADLLPAPYIQELSRLQTHAAPEPWETILTAITESLGRPATEVFARIDTNPFASASVAQVHRAWLLDGTAVVLKVQRPTAREQVTRDVDIILRLARWLARTAAWARRLGVEDLARGFADSLEDELDYRVELDNMRTVTEALGPEASIRVPVAYTDFSGRTLLVMDAIAGEPLSRAQALLTAQSAEQRSSLAKQLLTATLDQMITVGVFHADLHPGNIVILTDGGLGLLDFGAVGRIDPQTRTALGLLLHAIEHQDTPAALDSLLKLLDRPDDLHERTVERQLGQLMTRYRSGFKSSGSQEMFTELFSMVLAHSFKVPPGIGAVFRALTALEGSIALMDPGFNLVGTAREHGRRLMEEQLEPGSLKDQLEARAIQLVPLLERLPRRLDRITENLEQGQTQLRLRLFADPREQAFITGLVHQLIIAILVGAATLGAIILIISDTGPLITPTLTLNTLMGYALLFAGFILSLRSAALIFTALKR